MQSARQLVVKGDNKNLTLVYISRDPPPCSFSRQIFDVPQLRNPKFLSSYDRGQKYGGRVTHDPQAQQKAQMAKLGARHRTTGIPLYG